MLGGNAYAIALNLAASHGTLETDPRSAQDTALQCELQLVFAIVPIPLFFDRNYAYMPRQPQIEHALRERLDMSSAGARAVLLSVRRHAIPVRNWTTRRHFQSPNASRASRWSPR